jgi:hypothetical protein
MYVRTVSAEIADGTLPEKRLSPRDLWHNVPFNVPFPHPIRRGNARRRRAVQVDKPGERRDAWEYRAGEAVLGQMPEHARA